MKKFSVLMLSAFLCAASLCGCTQTQNPSGADSAAAESSIVSTVTEESTAPVSDTVPDSNWYVPSGSFEEMKNELKDILTTGGWQFLDGQMHGTEIEEADKGAIRGSSIWFNDDDTAVFTFDGMDFRVTYEIGKSADVGLYFEEIVVTDELRPYLSSGDNVLEFKFMKDEQYGMLLVDSRHTDSVKYFKAMI